MTKPKYLYSIKVLRRSFIASYPSTSVFNYSNCGCVRGNGRDSLLNHLSLNISKSTSLLTRFFSAKVNFQHLLTPSQCRDIIATNQQTINLIQQQPTSSNDNHPHNGTKEGIRVRRIESNYLSSNTPIEDRISIIIDNKASPNQNILETSTSHVEGETYRQGSFVGAGIFDGHLGPFCSHYLYHDFLNFLALTLSPTGVLEKIINDNSCSKSENDYRVIGELDVMRDLNYIQSKLNTPKFPATLYHDYVTKLLSQRCEHPKHTIGSEPWIIDAISQSFTTFDDIISKRAHLALHDISEPIPDKLSLQVIAKTFPDVKTAFSGSTACCSYIDNSQDPPVLFLANVGDSRAVLGSIGPNGEWSTTKLSYKHYADNSWESKRLKSEHPSSETNSILKAGRLLGYLMPTRSFGDMMFKWQLDDILKIRRLFPSLDIYVPGHYRSPPYLTAKPEIISHVIRPEDKFLIIASDGLWDFLTTRQVVKIVGDHLVRSKTAVSGGSGTSTLGVPGRPFQGPTSQRTTAEAENDVLSDPERSPSVSEDDVIEGDDVTLDQVRRDFRPDTHDTDWPGDDAHKSHGDSPDMMPTLTRNPETTEEDSLPVDHHSNKVASQDSFGDPRNLFSRTSHPERVEYFDPNINSATVLIENALGSNNYNTPRTFSKALNNKYPSGMTRLDYVKLSTLLKLPPEICRDFRDDISVLVLYFD